MVSANNRRTDVVKMRIVTTKVINSSLHSAPYTVHWVGIGPFIPTTAQQIWKKGRIGLC